MIVEELLLGIFPISGDFDRIIAEVLIPTEVCQLSAKKRVRFAGGAWRSEFMTWETYTVYATPAQMVNGKRWENRCNRWRENEKDNWKLL